ncbi:protein-disulfide reductase DsbD domain-containing protein [Agrobacterium larrymoorei]|uniref:Cytochrome C biogenesis protein n=1 Tax=Agrobacterium larrymoorei TaxID=160699 RepID=A0A4D7DS67_9HYPH|nr:protein-disulfide reductase DsbD domain-containing protein [Agrobacterium larrymoorei]QCI98507.1 cytochrome C biogenesis protein [Agrobacterium larrymoorei]QYA06029.1 cytochrome C biogenesis protein [Agrobacterium larrymoorei]
MIAQFFSASRIIPAALAMVLAVLSGTQSAKADTTEWATSEGGRMRVISLPPDASGRIDAVLQIDLKPGWITYWREPGEAGIPPQIKPDAAGISLSSMSFPVPKLIKNDDITDIGYDQPVNFPFTLQVDAGNGDDAKLNAFIGVCLNICIPFEASFDLRRNAAATDEEMAFVKASSAILPEQASDDFRVQNFHITPDKTLLGVELRLPEDAPKDVDIYVAGPSGYAYFEPQNLVRDKRKLSFYMNIKGLPKSYNPKGQTWHILVKSGERAMEAPLDFPAQ